MTLTARKSASAHRPVTVRSRVTSVGRRRTIIIRRREIIARVVERRRHVTAAELNRQVVVVRGTSIQMTVLTARDDARSRVNIVRNRTLARTTVRRTVVDVTLVAVKV